VEIKRVESEKIEQLGAERYLEGINGLLVPGGFGTRGIEGKVKAIKYARENKIPFFGICLGMQCATIEFARHVCGLDKANSTEFDKNTPHPVISLIEEQKKVTQMGGTMRLGKYPCRIKKGTKTYEAYKKDMVHERHRHRYEFNGKYQDIMAKNGLIVTGIYPKAKLVEIVELENHPWFIGSQFHPVFKSKPDNCQPLFREFIKASLEHAKKGAE
jgi:CTP synthase